MATSRESGKARTGLAALKNEDRMIFLVLFEDEPLRTR
jgi:hypothetical protein